MQVNFSRLREWSEFLEFAVTAEGISAYAAATNDEHPLHRSGAAAPISFAAVSVAPLLEPTLGPMIPAEDRRFGVHAAQDIRVHRLLVPGMVLRSRGAVVGVHPARTGTSVVVKTEGYDRSGALAAEGYLTLFLRGRAAAAGGGVAPPDHRASIDLRGVPPAASVVQRIDDDQTFRYADASGDRSRIHLDAEYARSVGLPGIIVHGMCTHAFAERAVVVTACADDPRRLRRLAVRFSRIVLPGQEITTQIWQCGERDGRAIYAFTTLNPDRKAVLQDGLAEVELPG